MTILVATASRHGSTQRVGEVVTQTLLDAGLEVSLSDVGEVSLDQARRSSAVIVGGAIYTGTWLPAATELFERVRATAVPTFSFAVGVKDITSDPTTQEWAQAAGPVSPGARPVFGGAINSELLSIRERSLLAMVRAKDAEYTDWNAVRGWAERVAGLLQPSLTT